MRANVHSSFSVIQVVHFNKKIVSVQIDFLIPGRQTFKKLDEERQSGRSRCLLNDGNGFLQLPPFLAAAVSLNR